MEQVVFKIESSLDFYRVTEALNELQIPFQEKRFTNSAFPSLSQEETFAEITVDAQHADLVSKIIAGNPHEKPVMEKVVTENAPPSKKRRRWTAVLVIYALVATAFAMKYWYDLNRAGERKNITGSWNYNSTVYIQKNLSTGNIVSSSFDANYDGNFELIRLYDKSGTLNSEWTDEDEDGYFERSVLFNKKGDIAGFSSDGDGDSYFDTTAMILQNHDTLYLIDADHDNQYERIDNH